MEEVQKYLSENPVWGGVLIAAFGILILFASIRDWNWVFGDISRVNYNTEKIDGLVNFFGRKTTRFIYGMVGIFIILAGLFWIWVYVR